MDTEYFDLKSVAERLNVSEAVIRSAIHRGELTALDLGRGYQFTKEWVDAWIRARTVNPDASTTGQGVK